MVVAPVRAVPLTGAGRRFNMGKTTTPLSKVRIIRNREVVRSVGKLLQTIQ
jgi:hypothetical protein